MTDVPDVLDALDQPLVGAAVGAALELGLFWLLETESRDAAEVGRALGIPVGRCRAWLKVLATAGLVEEHTGLYAPTAAARTGILARYSAETWRLLAQEARERLDAVRDLPRKLRARHERPSDGKAPYLLQMAEDPGRARRFTHMLYELHGPMAAQLAARLDLTGVRRLLDLGGGSGVVSIALAKRWPELSVTILDISNVCVAGREIVESEARSVAQRIEFYTADFLDVELPAGFDAVLECDVSIYSEPLFRRVRRALAPGGKFVIADEFQPVGGAKDPAHVGWALVRTLADPGWCAPTVDGTCELLSRSGFGPVTTIALSSRPGFGGRMSEQLALQATARPD
ncbi:MAG TPA: methyltransferase [Candidatus Limnocylindrales bacterium]